MPESLLPTRPPRRTLETAPFWDACAERRLVLPQCVRCDELIWYPRAFCPFCGSPEVRWTGLSGRGTVYSFTIVRRGDGPYKAHAPYVVAYVQLEEGPVMMTNIIGVDPGSVAIGQAVEVRWEPAGDDGQGNPTDHLPRFGPA
jgi:uncharacterized OB-fold protein